MERESCSIPGRVEEIRVKAPLAIDPLLTSFGFIPYYEQFSDPNTDTFLAISLKFNDGTRIREKISNDTVKSAGETCLFIERVTRSLEALEGKRYSEICFLREIGFFEEAVKTSKSLIDSYGEDRGKELDTILRAAWSLPGGARVLAMGEIEAFHLGDNLNRFSSAVNVIEEFARLFRILKYLEREGIDFRIPPVCRLGEIIYRYVNPTIVE